jgi:CheY-like chemotaxis protein
MNYRILLIEDEKNLRENIQELLELLGYKVTVAENGKQGLSLAIESLPDLILSDVMMPLMDGYSVLKAVKSNESSKHIPCILLTAKAEKSHLDDDVKDLVDGYVVKPFKFSDLQEVISKFLK